MIDALVKTVLNELKQISRNETVIGEPIQSGDVTLVPVSRVSIGFGAGGGAAGSTRREGEGTGGGIVIEPIAFVVIRGQQADILSIKKDAAGLGAIAEWIPEAIEAVREFAGKRREKSKQAGKEKK